MNSAPQPDPNQPQPAAAPLRVALPGLAYAGTRQPEGLRQQMSATAGTAAAAAIPAVQIDGLSVHYATQADPALSIGHLEVRPRERLALTGANGAGKSTLLKALCSLVQPDSGTIRIFGEKPSQARGLIAYLPQLRAIDWHYPVSVEDFALLGSCVRLGWLRRPCRNWKERTAALLEKLELYPLRKRPIRALSGGQQQRLLLARALLPEPQLYLLDEPLTAVDAHSVELIGSILQSEHEAGKTMIVATHHLDFGSRFRFDRQLRMHCGCVHAVQSDAEALHEEPLTPPPPAALKFYASPAGRASATTGGGSNVTGGAGNNATGDAGNRATDNANSAQR